MTESVRAFLPLKNYEPSTQTLAGAIDWKAGVRDFDDWLQSSGSQDARIPQAVVGLFGNTAHLLHAWAKEHSAQVLEAPSPAALLDGNAALWPQLKNPGKDIVVIPELERCFLRHYRGIRLVRELVETVWASPCRLVIGCDAWGWKYLQQAVQIDALCPEVITAGLLMAHPAESNVTPDIAPRNTDLRIQAYVLHTLLVHGGVDAAVLPQILPFRTTQTFKILSDLRTQQLAFEEDGIWRVVPAHYASIRRQLAAAEFWTSDI